MVLVGEQRAYFSHLPMFMTPHDYQAIFEVTLTTHGADALSAYVKDRVENPPGGDTRPDASSKMYGFSPTIDMTDQDPLTDPFILSDLVTPSDPGNPQSPAIREAFKGTVFRGHFENFHIHEKAGPPIIENVVARVTNAVLFRKFDPHAAALPQLEYFLFGTVGDLYLAHVISRGPDFDQILAVDVDSQPLTDDELRRALHVTVPGRSNAVTDKLREGESVSGRLTIPAGHPGGPRTVDVTVGVGVQHYFETDDLKSGPDHHM
jgi:hypothetical protein